MSLTSAEDLYFQIGIERKRGQWGTRKEKYERARISGKVAVEDGGFMNVVMYCVTLRCTVANIAEEKRKTVQLTYTAKLNRKNTDTCRR